MPEKDKAVQKKGCGGHEAPPHPFSRYTLQPRICFPKSHSTRNSRPASTGTPARSRYVPVSKPRTETRYQMPKAMKPTAPAHSQRQPRISAACRKKVGIL